MPNSNIVGQPKQAEVSTKDLLKKRPINKPLESVAEKRVNSKTPNILIKHKLQSDPVRPSVMDSLWSYQQTTNSHGCIISFKLIRDYKLFAFKFSSVIFICKLCYYN